MSTDLAKLLEDVRDRRISVAEAELQIKKEPFADMDFAKIDLHRKARQGTGEVIYGAGKTPEQIISIVKRLREESDDGVLVTRLSQEKASAIKSILPEFAFYEDAGIGIAGGNRENDGTGRIVIVTGGTSDIPVAEEAALTAEFLGNEVKRIYDVGVAGIHRLFAHLDDIMNASVIIAIAGMEGALASVVGGLADCPVIAVPTSVGYGASFEGLSALLSMLNSCASGVTVVNIDNGFGAAYFASMVNHAGKKGE
ncbi:MAG: nickel pincer cofactor biosynthesis protein LarB [Lachnospiraceae bacterium]|nr:nickel pincer cofactor biosynthesis protein LarB [Lachnospiraceae bacterium]